ncbi:MAG: hypothetical protein ACFE9R_13615 [Candidatus Hermodarchaeota archaeon]
MLWEQGMSFHQHLSKRITTIDKVTKTGFRIKAAPDRFFRFSDGHQKGLRGRQNMGTISRCHVISDKERIGLMEEFRVNRIKKDIYKAITQEKALDRLNSKQLEQLHNILELGE